jgi:uncharacterized protein YecE (DUF72 family)
MKLFLGTSGFGYREWKGKFYPKAMKPDEMLSYFAARMNATEVNSTFYRLPPKETVLSWREQSGARFSLSFKAPALITHRLRLKSVQGPLARFLRLAFAAEEQLGVLNFQLPPNFKLDLQRLRAFLLLLPKGRRYALEFRNETWFEEPVYAALKKAGVALTLNDADVEGAPLVATAKFGVLKLRRTRYTDAELKAWVRKIEKQPWKAVFVFFKHEEKATGPALAERFRRFWG